MATQSTTVLRVPIPRLRLFIGNLISFARDSERWLGTAIQFEHRTTLVTKTAIVLEMPLDLVDPFFSVVSGKLQRYRRP
jgi:hypothetical protein